MEMVINNYNKSNYSTIVLNKEAIEQELNKAIINSVSGASYVFTSSMSKEARIEKFKEMIGD